MIFSSFIFIFCFLPIVLFLYFVVCKKRRLWQNVILLLSSLLFYAWGEPVFVFVMLAFVVINWFCALRIEKNKSINKKAKFWLVLSLIFDISLIFVFKYLVFVLDNFKLLINISFEIHNIILPIGISFFTFQSMSYVIDIYRGKGKAQKNPLYVGLYIAFFPQLIAGPIVRYETVAEQIICRKESIELFSEGIKRFILGLGKKVILANTLAIVADSAFSMTGRSVVMAWLGAISYSLQILFDFSGYSDMAIGLGKMFGFEFDENFNYPYLSSSISEFWRRWHISMGTWFRDYVYFPLGGSRVKSKARLIFNLLIVWILTGLWHGANWTFVVWGLFYFVFILIEKLTGIEKKKFLKPIGHVYTLLLVMLGWVLFRSDTIGDSVKYIATMFGNGTFIDDISVTYLKENVVVLCVAIICCFPILKSIGRLIKNNTVKNVLIIIGLSLVLLISVTYIVKGSYNPFIYFNF